MQLLVDSLLTLAPIALYAKVGAWSVYLAGILTLFYKGLLELSKSFLDPFGNEDFLSENIQIDVLLAESNSRANKWASEAAELPFDLRTGEAIA